MYSRFVHRRFCRMSVAHSPTVGMNWPNHPLTVFSKCVTYDTVTTTSGSNYLHAPRHLVDSAICLQTRFRVYCPSLIACTQVKAPWVHNFYYYDSDTYIIPSKDDGTVVLGGCRHFGSYNEQTNDRNTEEILENCVALIPSLADALKTGYEVWVGLRPYRNQIRVETERVNQSVVIAWQ